MGNGKRRTDKEIDEKEKDNVESGRGRVAEKESDS